MTSYTDPGSGESQELRLAPPAPARRPHVPQLVVALFLVALFALLAVVFYTQATAREPVVALAVDVARGEAITPDMLQVVYVSTDDAVALVSPDASAAMLGQRAIGDLEAGTLVSGSLFVDNTALGAGEALVGLSLGPGEYPSPFLAVGDHVAVVRTVRDSAELAAAIGEVAPRLPAEGELPPPAPGVADLVLADAVVFDISEIGTQGGLFVTLRLAEDDAPIVAAGHAANAVRLVQIPAPETP